MDLVEPLGAAFFCCVDVELDEEFGLAAVETVGLVTLAFEEGWAGAAEAEVDDELALLLFVVAELAEFVVCLLILDAPGLAPVGLAAPELECWLSVPIM